MNQKNEPVVQNLTNLDFESFSNSETANLPKDTLQLIQNLLQQIQKTESQKEEQIKTFKKISGIWYSRKIYLLAGYYAEMVAKLDSNANAWKIAGSSYYSGISNAPTEAISNYCFERAKIALEKAQLINPNDIEIQINLASLFVSKPNPKNPMMGIQMLLALNQKHPENIQILNLLGSLALKTNQFEKAIIRLEKSFELDPNNQQTPCLLALAYEGAKQTEKYNEIKAKCKTNL